MYLDIFNSKHIYTHVCTHKSIHTDIDLHIHI